MKLKWIHILIGWTSKLIQSQLVTVANLSCSYFLLLLLLYIVGDRVTDRRATLPQRGDQLLARSFQTFRKENWVEGVNLDLVVHCLLIYIFLVIYHCKIVILKWYRWSRNFEIDLLFVLFSVISWLDQYIFYIWHIQINVHLKIDN